ncbi:2-dehydropantoate 2-reductase [Cadophora sp. MPI-SDFR-AT-0126]|nr:2-dehydropantoate 2-reductase [Leotiomycetes sp. MPI-SDFR-AT-0126]
MPPTPNVHILGLGNLGRLFAHALATSPHPPSITLLFHRPSLLEDWESAGRQIQITSKDLTTTSSSSNYSVEVIKPNPNPSSTSSDPPSTPSPESEPIQNLLITTKAQHTLSALTPLLPRLTQTSTLLFAQNGLGTIDEVTSALFSNPATRPRYLAAITSHGVYSTGPFQSVHAGLADVKVGPVDAQSTSLSTSRVQEADQTAPFLNALTSSPLLNCTSVPARTLKSLQLEKLTINAILNPLTAILGIKNGEILQHAPVRKVTRLIVEECSRILISLPELQVSSLGSDSTEGQEMTLTERFSPTRLLTLVQTVAQKTAANTSSMLQDVQGGRETEIEYINGYFVRRAREVGVECVVNERMVEMVRGGIRIGIGELEGWFEGLEGER